MSSAWTLPWWHPSFAIGEIVGSFGDKQIAQSEATRKDCVMWIRILIAFHIRLSGSQLSASKCRLPAAYCKCLLFVNSVYHFASAYVRKNNKTNCIWHSNGNKGWRYTEVSMIWKSDIFVKSESDICEKSPQICGVSIFG